MRFLMCLVTLAGHPVSNVCAVSSSSLVLTEFLSWRRPDSSRLHENLLTEV